MALMYPEIDPGQLVTLKYKKFDYKMACCDCNLVHRFRFFLGPGKDEISWKAYRDNRATVALRRNRGVGVLKTKERKKERKRKNGS